MPGSRVSARVRVVPGSAPTPRAAPIAARPRILVVDDEAAIRELLSKTLALADYDVDLAPDGRTALERLRIIRTIYSSRTSRCRASTGWP